MRGMIYAKISEFKRSHQTVCISSGIAVVIQHKQKEHQKLIQDQSTDLEVYGITVFMRQNEATTTHISN